MIRPMHASSLADSIQRSTQTNRCSASIHVIDDPAPMANHDVRGADGNSCPVPLSQTR